jgi:hypothetical protein
MKLFRYLLLTLATLTLMGCGPIYQTHYDYQLPHSERGKMCVNECLQAKSTCEQMNRMNEESCRDRELKAARYEYQAYRDRQERHHQPVKKSVEDFNHGYRCNQSSDCEASYKMCYQNCGGVIKENRVCVAFCDKK